MAKINYLYSNDNHSYEIDNFDEVKASYEEWVKNNIHTSVVIDSDDVYKAIYKERTALNKELENLSNDKKVINEIIIGKFNSEVDELSKYLKGVKEELNGMLETYKPKAPVYEYKFKTTDKEKYDTIVAFIEKTLGLGGNE